MQVILTYVALTLIGLCLGSFAGASVWRLRARQLVQDKATGEEYDKGELKQLKKLTSADVLHDHSVCLHCSYKLRWYDLIPLISWVSLGGKCRSCRAPIGYMEPLIELGTALFFVFSYMLWPSALVSPLEITHFVAWLAAGVGLAILFVYDAKWFLLPDKVNITVIALGVVTAVTVLLRSSDIVVTLIEIAGSVMILSGIYLILYLVSKGRWIGFGDIKLGLGLALLLADWRLAFVALFSANLIGCLFVIPGMVTGKLKRNTHVPFGPLLIAGTILAQLFGPALVAFYIDTLL